MTLPRDFLMEIGGNYDLSPEQKDAFVIWFSSNKTELEIATELHISNSALTTRMSHVYKKFSINGKGPGKYGRLLNFLTAEYRKCQASDSPTSNLSEDELKDLVQEVRQNCREMIQDQCGKMRSLTMSQPIDVSDLYTNVNILEKITRHRRREIDELLQDCNPENFDRFGLSRVTDKRIPGLEAVEKNSKLMVLGKPGSGKTTFLKYLAIQCNQGNFQAHRVPIFITLKQFAETEGKPSLLEYITQMFSDCDVFADNIAVLFKHGKTLVLLDGLDEVKDEDNNRVIKQVRDFSDKFRTNHFVITCRIAAKDYTFEKFTEVEVADFDDEQIDTFAQKWFQSKEPAKAEEFIEQLMENDRIRELATNPLLLTLLCLVFEEPVKFPVNGSELYEEAVDILLSRWDETRNIERDLVYKNLSLQHKKDLLSQIALTNFERGDYLFKQKELEQCIGDYIRNLPDAQNEPEALPLDSKAVLKSIEAQHGLLVERAQKIYSFSHLTFQEYFTARRIVSNSDPQALQKLACHLTESRWREVFLLTVEMLPSADNLLRLMKLKIEQLLDSDQDLQNFVSWVNIKSSTAYISFCKEVAIRAFYFEFSYRPYIFYHLEDLVPSLFTEDLKKYYNFIFLNFEEDFNYLRYEETAIDVRLLKVFNGLRQGDIDSVDLEEVIDLSRILDSNCPLHQILEELKIQKNREETNEADYLDWITENSAIFADKLRQQIINYRNIGHAWNFRANKEDVLLQYHDANKLLVICLNSGAAHVSSKVRKEIEETLFLSKDEIEKWRQREPTST
ncbi:NACHT domain-containing protein [Microcoleus vaginatus]|uniref:NACHT domain-containing protein n=1 Tax=Microcoleus vaginatus TaxID=119532 RepID=UPI00168436D5|nr:NACHT domain-containing NTPase [Microcoleus sp. FACHB-84]MBD2008837.1 NACHT domain-containing NTPase [Microcoleus sp. FACHB-45]